MTHFKPRNPFAHTALMRKGGCHRRSASSQRFADRQAWLAELDDEQDDQTWMPDDRNDNGTTGKPGCGPVFSCLPLMAAGHLYHHGHLEDAG